MASRIPPGADTDSRVLARPEGLRRVRARSIRGAPRASTGEAGAPGGQLSGGESVAGRTDGPGRRGTRGRRGERAGPRRPTAAGPFDTDRASKRMCHILVMFAPGLKVCSSASKPQNSRSAAEVLVQRTSNSPVCFQVQEMGSIRRTSLRHVHVVTLNYAFRCERRACDSRSRPLLRNPPSGGACPSPIHRGPPARNALDGAARRQCSVGLRRAAQRIFLQTTTDCPRVEFHRVVTNRAG